MCVSGSAQAVLVKWTVYAGPAIEENTLMARAALTILATLGWLTVLPAGVATQSEQRAIGLVPTHAIRGIVRSIATSSITIAGCGKKIGELTFVLLPTTHREGLPSVGGTVSLRYRREGDRLVATAISAQPERPQSAR
jgi:hypothetical protein